MKEYRMKDRFTFTSTRGFIGCLALCPLYFAGAIEPPPDTAQPPAELLRKTIENTDEISPRVDAQSIAFIGLSSATLPGMVADHVGLQPGQGVIVRSVYPGGPADKAGLVENDIILSIGETLVGNPEAFSSAIRERKAGDQIPVELIHEGKRIKAEVTLSERPEGLAADSGQSPMFDGIPDAQADRLRGMIERNLGGGRNEAGRGDIFPDRQFEDAFRMMRERMGNTMNQQIPQEDADGVSGIQQSSTVRVMDGTGSIELKSNNGKTNVTVRDASNETLWAGPWNTDEDKAAAPEDIRKRIDKVNSGGTGSGFTFRLGKLRNNDPGTVDPGTIDN
jgi:hypothetical protein